MIYPLVWRLGCKGGWEGLKRHIAECVCWHSHDSHWITVIRECPPGPSWDLPRWVCLLQVAALKTSSESQGQLLLHRNQNYSPSHLSWAGDLQVQTRLGVPLCSLLWPAGSTPPGRLWEHLLQREARGIMLAQATWSVSHRSQATFVRCSVSFLVSLC